MELRLRGLQLWAEWRGEDLSPGAPVLQRLSSVSRAARRNLSKHLEDRRVDIVNWWETGNREAVTGSQFSVQTLNTWDLDTRGPSSPGGTSGTRPSWRELWWSCRNDLGAGSVPIITLGTGSRPALTLSVNEVRRLQNSSSCQHFTFHTHSVSALSQGEVLKIEMFMLRKSFRRKLLWFFFIFLEKKRVSWFGWFIRIQLQPQPSYLIEIKMVTKSNQTLWWYQESSPLLPCGKPSSW